MTPINAKQIFGSILIVALGIISYGILQFHLNNQEARVEQRLATAYQKFQNDFQISCKILQTYGNSFVQKSATPISHKITEPPHQSILQAYFLAADLKDTPAELQDDLLWPDIEKTILLSKGVAGMAHSACFVDKSGKVFFWNSMPLYKEEKFVGYILSKNTLGETFNKNGLVQFFLVQEFQLPIPLSGQNTIPKNLPALSDPDIFNETTFTSKVNDKGAIFSTKFHSELNIGFVAMYPRGHVDTIFIVIIIFLLLTLALVWIQLIIAAFLHCGKIVHHFITTQHPIMAITLFFIAGFFTLKYTTEFHQVIHSARIALLSDHEHKNIALAQKINTACFTNKNHIADKATIERILETYTPTKIESLFITDATNKVLVKFAQSRKTAQDFLCKMVGTSQANCKVEIPNWTLHSTYAIAYQELPLQKMRTSLLLAIICLTLFIILAWYVYHIILNKKLAAWLFIALPSLAACNFLLWGVINYIPVTHFDSDNTLKTAADNSLLGAKADIIAGNKQLLPPTRVTLGMVLQNMDLTQVNRAAVQGLLWQIAPAEDMLGITIANGRDTKIDELTKTNTGNTHKIMWRLFSNITSPDDYKRYPFSIKHVKIGFAVKNVHKPTLLIPDQTLLQLNKIPWLSHEVSNPGFTLIEHSITSEFITNDTLRNVSQGFNNTLVFNLSFRESLAGALFTYIFPLFIILLAIFGILWVPETFRFTAYSGVFFADILLHRTLRSSLNLVQVSYLDCFFFFTYLALIMLMCGTLFGLSRPSSIPIIDRVFKLIYWPLQLVLWIITTAIFFC